MSKYKIELIAELAEKLKSYGYRVFVAQSKTYGFFTDAEGTRVVSFGGHWNFSIDFSGNYTPTIPANGCYVGTGWQIDKEANIPDQQTASRYFDANPPYWATNGLPVKLTTLEQHLKTYQNSSKYTEV